MKKQEIIKIPGYKGQVELQTCLDCEANIGSPNMIEGRCPACFSKMQQEGRELYLERVREEKAHKDILETLTKEDNKEVDVELITSGLASTSLAKEKTLENRVQELEKEVKELKEVINQIKEQVNANQFEAKVVQLTGGNK